MLEFTVEGQKLNRIDLSYTVQSSQNYLRAVFAFRTTDWTDTVKTAVFMSSEDAEATKYCQILDENDSCYIPDELSECNKVGVSVFGTSKSGTVRVTTNTVHIVQDESGYAEGETPQPPSQDVYEQLISKATDAEKIAQSVRDDAEKGKFNGKDGSKGATYSPSVNQDGDLSWTNDAGLPNPPTVNIKGEKGDSGGSMLAELDLSKEELTKKYYGKRFENIPEGNYVISRDGYIASTSNETTQWLHLLVGDELRKDGDRASVITNSGTYYITSSDQDFSLCYQPTSLEVEEELENKADYDDIPTYVSELKNDANYATEQFVEREIANFDFIKIVTELPVTGLPNRTYFVPKTDTDTNDLYDEYMWVNNVWEFIGRKTIDIDLSNYIKNTDFATSENAGVIRLGNGVQMNPYNQTQAINLDKPSYQKQAANLFLSKGTFESLKTKSTDSLDDADDVSIPTSLKVKNELANKADVTTKDIDLESTTATIVITDNKIFKRGTLASLDIRLLTLTANDDYLATLVFNSGATKTSLICPYNIKWLGDDLSNGKFSPVANKDYDITFNWNGRFWTAIVNGNEVSV